MPKRYEVYGDQNGTSRRKVGEILLTFLGGGGFDIIDPDFLGSIVDIKPNSTLKACRNKINAILNVITLAPDQEINESQLDLLARIGTTEEFISKPHLYNIESELRELLAFLDDDEES